MKVGALFCIFLLWQGVVQASERSVPDLPQSTSFEDKDFMSYITFETFTTSFPDVETCGLKMENIVEKLVSPFKKAGLFTEDMGNICFRTNGGSVKIRFLEIFGAESPEGEKELARIISEHQDEKIEEYTFHYHQIGKVETIQKRVWLLPEPDDDLQLGFEVTCKSATQQSFDGYGPFRNFLFQVQTILNMKDLSSVVNLLEKDCAIEYGEIKKASLDPKFKYMGLGTEFSLWLADGTMIPQDILFYPWRWRTCSIENPCNLP